MSLRRARSVEEYVEWVSQAAFEVDGLRDCLEYEIEDMSRFPVFLDPLEEGVKAVYESMKAGTYSFGREDLPFMDLAARYAEAIPVGSRFPVSRAFGRSRALAAMKRPPTAGAGRAEGGAPTRDPKSDV
jgi:hypothetical protein